MQRIITITILLSWLAFAQQQTPPPNTMASVPDTGVKISTTTQLVVEDVLLKGKDGNAITGLKPSDFTVLEDGKPQKISVFEFQTLEEGPDNAAVARPPAPRITPAPLGPDVKPLTAVAIAPEAPGSLKYSNRRLMVMFFDLTSM